MAKTKAANQEADPRPYMQKAIEVMRLSVSESRTDGKVAPKVGAVLVEASGGAPLQGPITTAYRGEFRDGDHAEYTLLERKKGDQKLDGCVLFASLEPCAPDARSDRK